MKYEIQNYQKTWQDNLKLFRSKKPLQPVNMKKIAGMDENVDEMMIAVARETNYSLADLEKMEIIRFIRIVDNVKKIIKMRTGQEEAETNNQEGHPRRRQSVKY